MQRFPLIFQFLKLRFSGVFQFLSFGFPVTAKHNIGTTTGHISRYGDSAGTAGLSDNIRFLFVELGVQHFVRHFFFLQKAGQQFRVFDRHRTDQYRLTFFHCNTDVCHNGVVFFLCSQINQVGHIFTGHWTVGRNNHGFQSVNRLEFKCFGIGSTGHTGKFVV